MRFLPAILSGDEHWCQGYSEPDAGSDLAALRTRAALDGDEWVVDGQKIWTSHAFDAQWCFVLARTTPGASGHRGISFLLVPMEQPGVEVRRIRQMTGESDFCEVFFTGARTAADNVVGDVGDGWRVAMSLLGHERGEEAATNPLLFRAELDRLIVLARERGLTSDPVVRQRLADCAGQSRGHADLGPSRPVRRRFRWRTRRRRLRIQALLERVPPVGHVVGRRPAGNGRADPARAGDRCAPIAPTIQGVPPDSTASWAGVWMNAVAGTIYAGTSEVQRNILAESVLGLPREPRVQPRVAHARREPPPVRSAPDEHRLARSAFAEGGHPDLAVTGAEQCHEVGPFHRQP